LAVYLICDHAPHRDLHSFPTRRSSDLLVLSVIAVAAFAAVLGLTTRFHSWQASLAETMRGRGERDLQTGRAGRAIEDFRSALARSEEHTSELQSPCNLVCRLLLEKKKK